MIFRPLYKVVEKKDDIRNTIRKLTNRDEIKYNKFKENMDIKEKMLDPKRISVNNAAYFTFYKSRFNLNHQPYRIVKEYFDPQYYRVIEEELFQADSGYCFGEWALIYNQPRSASVIALEDSVFFILDEKIFSKTFLKCLNTTEHKKKKFILETLFPFNLYSDRRNSLYKDIIPKICERNQVVFTEGDIADTIYLLYSGTYYLEKNYKNQIFRFKSVEKGSILGLESIFEGEESKYKCTLKLSSLNEFGMVACCKVSKLVPYIMAKMKSAFKLNYELYVQSNKDFYIKNINYENNILFKKKNKSEEESEIIEKYIEEFNLMDQLEKLRNKMFQFNTLQQVKLDKKYKLYKTEKSIKIDLLNNKKEIKQANFSRKIKKSRTIKITKACDYGAFTKSLEKISNVKKMLTFKRMNTFLPFKNTIDLNKENNGRKKRNAIDISDENNKENDLKGTKLRKFNLNLYIKELLSYDYKPSIIENLKERSKYNKNYTLNTEESKNFNKTFYSLFKHKTIETTKSRNTQYETNKDYEKIYLTEFPISKHNKLFRFDSGKYKLPLMAQIYKTK